MGWYGTEGVVGSTPDDIRAWLEAETGTVFEDFAAHGASNANGAVQIDCYATVRRQNGEILGVVFLVEWRGDTTGYKAISEDMGPYYWRMPERMLRTLRPEPYGELSAKWRAECWRRLRKGPELARSA